MDFPPSDSLVNVKVAATPSNCNLSINEIKSFCDGHYGVAKEEMLPAKQFKIGCPNLVPAEVCSPSFTLPSAEDIRHDNAVFGFLPGWLISLIGVVSVIGLLFVFRHRIRRLYVCGEPRRCKEEAVRGGILLDDNGEPVRDLTEAQRLWLAAHPDLEPVELAGADPTILRRCQEGGKSIWLVHKTNYELIVGKFFPGRAPSDAFLAEDKVHEFLKANGYPETVLRRAHPCIAVNRGGKYLPVGDGWILFTIFCSNGSLEGYLSADGAKTSNTFSLEEGIILIKHIDMAIRDLHRLGVAHLDVKSDNCFLHVSSEGLKLFVADLDFAVIRAEYEQFGEAKLGQARYRYPGFLKLATVNDMHLITPADRIPFESLQRADRYAAALVIWEILRGCRFFGQPNGLPHIPPYHDLLQRQRQPPRDHVIEILKNSGVASGHRPEIPAHWKQHQVVKQIVRLMEDMWDPVAQLGMVQVDFDHLITLIQPENRNQETWIQANVLSCEDELLGH